MSILAFIFLTAAAVEPKPGDFVYRTIAKTSIDKATLEKMAGPQWDGKVSNIMAISCAIDQKDPQQVICQVEGLKTASPDEMSKLMQAGAVPVQVVGTVK